MFDGLNAKDRERAKAIADRASMNAILFVFGVFLGIWLAPQSVALFGLVMFVSGMNLVFALWRLERLQIFLMAARKLPGNSP